MKHWLHIILVALLALQPVAAVWAASGSPCDMAAMHDSMPDAASECPGCDDSCDSQACMTVCASAGGALQSVDATVASVSPTRGCLLAPMPLIPSGHDGPDLRPPISS